MPKIKNMCGVACKPIHKSRDQRHLGDYPTTKVRKTGLGLVNVLTFSEACKVKLAIISQIFVCLAVLMVPADVWAGLTSLSLDANGDTIFRGKQERLSIVFTVDDNTDDDGDSYIVTANQHLIRRGTVSADQSVRISWNGTINNRQLPDGNYTISVVLNKAGAAGEVLERSANAILDTKPPRISSVFANQDTNLLLTNGIFINVPLRAITVVPEADEGSPIDFGAKRTAVVLKNAQGVALNGALNYATQLSFNLADPLDIRSENGRYTLAVTLLDKAGNSVQSTTEFTFDNVAPTLTGVAGSSGVISPGAGVSQRLNFVEAILADNFENGVNLSDSTIRLTGPAGEILGRQTFPAKDKIRWVFLSPLSPRDGLHDGGYTIEVVGTDRAGNQSSTIRVPFVYDNLAPEIVSLSPTQDGGAFNRIGDTIYHNQPLTQIVASFNDGSTGIGVDFEENTQIQFSAIGDGNTSGVLPGRTFIDRNNAQITHVLEKPLVSQDGRYRLEVQVADTIGNMDMEAFLFLYDTQLPTLVSTFPSANETVDSLSQVRVVLNEVTSGIDFTQSSFRLIRSVGGTQVEVPVNITNNGTDTATLTVLEPIALDGSDDGTYAIEVIPTDRAGNIGATARREFYLVSQSRAEVQLTMPETTTVNNLDVIVAELIDYIGPGINIDESTLTVANSQGVVIPERKIETDATNTILTWSTDAVIPRDGTADGEYTITATFIDFTGKRFTQAFPILLDTQFPAIENVRVGTESDLVLSTDSTTNITVGFSQIIVNFEDLSQNVAENLPISGSDVDFTNTNVTLVSPGGEDIPINRFDNGRTTLTLNFRNLTQPGEYVLSITPQDLTGNQSTAPFVYRFQIDVALPIVGSVLIDGRVGTIVYVNGTSTSIVATFADPTGVGLALGEGGSTITVTNESGLPAPGITTSNGTNQLTWIPIVLPTDGSADGRYTVAVTPVDRTGRGGEVVYRQFIYDTQEPRVTAAVPVNLSQLVSYIGGTLTQLQFSVEDVGPAGLELEDQTIELHNADGVPVAGTLTTDEINNQLYLTFAAPFPRDGSADGEYLIKFSLVDKSGNRLDAEHKLVYDSQAPRLSSVIVNTASPMALLPQRVTEILESISSITLKFEEETRVDFSNTQITLLGPEEFDASDELVRLPIPLTLEDDSMSEVVVNFLELTEVGSYILSVTPQDIASNSTSGAATYEFVLDIPLPSVDSVAIGGQTSDVAYVNASNMVIVAALLDPTETGLTFGSQSSRILVSTPDGTSISGATGTNNVDLIAWEPTTFTSDGSTDGRYSVYVVPVDKAGRQGNAVYREFVYDTQEPEITSADPIDLSQPVSYISHNLTQFRFTVVDVGPAELELSDQTVSLRDANGNLIPTQLTHDTNSELFLTLDEPLSRDGSMDGEYTVLIELTDKASNAFTVEHLIVYDTQAPTLVSTVPADGALVTADRTQVQVTLNDDGGSGIDWEVTTVTLVDPNGSQISGELVSDGTTHLTLNTNQLIEDGRYIIRVQAVDRAGNGGATVFERSFLLSRRLPAIVSTSPTTAPADEAFTNEEVEEIEIMLETDDENHLSTLRLLNSANQVIAGQQLREPDRLVYNLVRPLATDGSDDGIYTIEFTPISSSGRAGDVQLLNFTHDTEAPEIEPEAINLVVASPEVNNSLTEIRVNPIDEQSGIDWKNVDEEWVVFERVSPNPTKIAGRVEDDNQSVLSFILTVPLADNGSADGEYRVTITPKDQAGNGDISYEKVFTYDTSPPLIDAGTLLLNDAPLLVDIDAENYPTSVSTTGGVVIQANMFDTGLGVNLAQSRIVVRSPDGTEISGNTQQNGVDTIIFKSDGLSTQGLYQVTVISIGNDSELLGFAPTNSITTEFLYETTAPTAAVTSDGGETELTDKALPLEGTASDPSGTQGGGEGAISIPASGVWLVEIVGIGPDKQPIDPVPAVDDSSAEQEPWSVWSIDFLPTRSGEYDLDVRVTDNAGNYEVYDIGEYTMSVSLTFREPTFGWPNPLRISRGDVAFFSFDVNVPLGETVELTLSIYDWSGDMILSQTYPDVVSGQRNDQLVKWNLENQAGNHIARGLYIFHLEAINAAGNSANAVGKVIVVD